MSEHVEIEYKNLLTKKEYERLLEYFQLSTIHMKNQVNHYFDTTAFSLKENHSALRIREKHDGFELTLKQPAPIGLLETNQVITPEEADKLLRRGSLPEGEVKMKLSSLPIPINDIEYFGSLTTNRIEIDYNGGTLVFDHSTYLNVEDFEIEYEVTDPLSGKEIFTQLLASFKIPTRVTDNKVQRFYIEKSKKRNEKEEI